MDNMPAATDTDKVSVKFVFLRQGVILEEDLDLIIHFRSDIFTSESQSNAHNPKC